MKEQVGKRKESHGKYLSHLRRRNGDKIEESGETVGAFMRQLMYKQPQTVTTQKDREITSYERRHVESVGTFICIIKDSIILMVKQAKEYIKM